MKEVEYYRGREQTYLKHFFLDQYLGRVAYVIGWSHPQFVYVDGFSGPWRSEDQAFEDTSFVIAIQKLRQVRAGLARAGKRPRIRCLFIEKDRTAFEGLQQAISDVSDLEIKALQGEFENLIPDIVQFVGGSFALVFIDPSGWTGFGLRRITPILEHRPGEVLVNFMFDHVNRFLDDPRPKIAASFDELLGGPGWDAAVQPGPRREDAIVALYRERMRTAGGFEHVTSTRILKPLADRSYFYLIYGTRHVKGLREFRAVEKRVVKEQERIRLAAKQAHRIERSGQTELFAPGEFVGPPSFEQERAAQHTEALSHLRLLLRSEQRVRFERALGVLLEKPLVWETDVQKMVGDMRRAGEIDVQGLGPRQRKIEPGHVLVSRAPRSR
ncbi:MAG TPA: three-Cys-motif partner protein TcmP [Thermoanaerobaculia bacterium]|nr:three-Cys-motif partner protein TcmP [Thermoanaerobaculia bacterium]